MKNKTSKNEHPDTIVVGSYFHDDGREFKYLSLETPPINELIFIHTNDDKCLGTFACDTHYHGFDFLILETEKWIEESEVKGWCLPQLPTYHFNCG